MLGQKQNLNHSIFRNYFFGMDFSYILIAENLMGSLIQFIYLFIFCETLHTKIVGLTFDYKLKIPFIEKTLETEIEVRNLKIYPTYKLGYYLCFTSLMNKLI